MKELEQGNEPNKSDYGLDLEQWGELSELIKDEGYAKNVIIQRDGIGNPVIYVRYSSAKVTMDGFEFIEQNSGLAKTYKGIKEIRDWLKL